VRGVLPVDNEVEIREGASDDGDRARGSEWVATGSARGVPLVGLGAREVKAVTYSEMALAETDDGWRAYVVFDV